MAVKPKLAMIPSGVGTDTLYSVLPSDGTGDFTFDRNLNTATRINKDGLIEMVDTDVPRLNYPLIDGVVSGCPSLLLEPQSLNQITYSENILHSSWDKINATVDSNQVISPDGTQNADRVNFNVSNGFCRLKKSSLSSVDSISFFIKYIDLEYILLFTDNSSRGNYINIKEGYVTDETLGGGMDISIKKYPNDWLRIEATNANDGSSLEILASNSQLSFNPITVDGSFYLWGCQAEANSYVTSYVPTTTSTATRSAETCNNAGDVNTFNDSEGVLMAEVNFENNDTNKGISISDGTSSNRVLFYLATNGNLYGYVFNGNGSIPIVNIIDTNFQINSTAKLAIKYKQNDFSFWVNGIEIGTETNGNIFSSGVLDQLSFTSYGPSANPFYGNTKQLQYFDTALTDTDLEELTSWSSFNEMANAQQYTIL